MWPFQKKKQKQIDEYKAEKVKAIIKDKGEPELKKVLSMINSSIAGEKVRVGLEINWIIEEIE